jgi:hypothetical protein
MGLDVAMKQLNKFALYQQDENTNPSSRFDPAG